MTGVSVTDYYELLALHRCLLEAKFSTDPNDGDIAGSPIVAGLSRQVVRALSEHVKGGSTDWGSWLRLDSTRREWRVALARAVEDREYWSDLSPDDRRTYVADLLAPFEVSSEKIGEFMQEAGLDHAP